jgi:hypothetical protein
VRLGIWDAARAAVELDAYLALAARHRVAASAFVAL